ncbi:unnamed protein product [Ectocarpus sp. 12 AP-2014]
MWGGGGKRLTGGIHPGMEKHLAGVAVGRHAFDLIFFLCVCFFVLGEWEGGFCLSTPFSFLLSASFVRHVSCCNFLMAVRKSLFLWGLLQVFRHAARTWHGILRRGRYDVLSACCLCWNGNFK